MLLVTLSNTGCHSVCKHVHMTNFFVIDVLLSLKHICET